MKKIISPFADLFSKTKTESLTLKPARSPSERTSRRFWFASFGQRVPTAEMLSHKKTGTRGKKVRGIDASIGKRWGFNLKLGGKTRWF